MNTNGKKAPWDRYAFLLSITAVGGYMNAYTYVTRNKVFSNMHTSNMSKLGIALGRFQWAEALEHFMPILMCILGAAFSEWIKKIYNAKKLSGDWRKAALIIEATMLFITGFISPDAPDKTVTLSVSFIMGFQLCLFRTYGKTAHNTTICTGNIRNVGQLFFGVLDKRDSDALIKFLTFAGLTFSFTIGSAIGTVITDALLCKSVWVCSIVLLAEALWIYIYEKHC